MAKLKYMVLAALVLSVGCVGKKFRLPKPAKRQVQQTCINSSECSAGQCCRDSVGNTIVQDPESHIFVDLTFDGATNGVCVSGGAQHGELCDYTCQCASDLQCYRPITGACCAPSRCYTPEEVQEDQDKWICAYPARRRREVPALLGTLCPDLPQAPPSLPEVPEEPQN